MEWLVTSNQFQCILSFDLLIIVDGESKVDKFQSLLEDSVLNLDELRQLSWSGVPARLRSVTWRLLSVSNKGKLYHTCIPNARTSCVILKLFLFLNNAGIFASQSRTKTTRIGTQTFGLLEFSKTVLRY